MNHNYSIWILLLWLALFPLLSMGQEVIRNPLIWERNLIDLGAVLEERGEVTVEYFFVNKADFPIFIEDVITDCGCTTADYTKDTLFQDKIGSVKIAFDPSQRGGRFAKMILVKTNIDSDGDSLFLEGYNIPLPENMESYYKTVHGGLGLSTTVFNWGNVFTKDPGIKSVDFYNYNEYPVQLNQIQKDLPEYIRVKMIPEVVPSKTRGILEFTYDAVTKQDLGFFEEVIEVSVLADEPLRLPLKFLVTVHEHFDPVRVEDLNFVPRLAAQETEVDLDKIKANMPVSKIIGLKNEGQETLNIRKIITNCDCLTYDLARQDIEPGERLDLTFTFDPKGRKGIDHKTLTIFSNDPLNPTRTIVIKSRIN